MIPILVLLRKHWAAASVAVLVLLSFWLGFGWSSARADSRQFQQHLAQKDSIIKSDDALIRTLLSARDTATKHLDSAKVSGAKAKTDLLAHVITVPKPNTNTNATPMDTPLDSMQVIPLIYVSQYLAQDSLTHAAYDNVIKSDSVIIESQATEISHLKDEVTLLKTEEHHQRIKAILGHIKSASTAVVVTTVVVAAIVLGGR